LSDQVSYPCKKQAKIVLYIYISIYLYIFK
jgi:hypothetical protein